MYCRTYLILDVRPEARDAVGPVIVVGDTRDQ
jgi:hypothetical protein